MLYMEPPDVQFPELPRSIQKITNMNHDEHHDAEDAVTFVDSVTTHSSWLPFSSMNDTFVPEVLFLTSLLQCAKLFPKFNV